jgi:hypothetical protein
MKNTLSVVDQENLLQHIFDEIALLTKLDIEAPSNQFTVGIERFEWHGCEQDLAAIKRLTTHTNVVDIHAVVFKGIVHDVILERQKAFLCVDVTITLQSMKRGYIPLWDAIRATYSTLYDEWWRERPQLHDSQHLFYSI